MRLTEIPGVGEKAAQSLYEEGNFQTAEGVAYAFGPSVVSCSGIDANIYLNSQELCAEMSDLGHEATMANQRYWCSYCDIHEGISKSFSGEAGCLTHMNRCSECPPGYGDL